MVIKETVPRVSKVRPKANATVSDTKEGTTSFRPFYDRSYPGVNLKGL